MKIIKYSIVILVLIFITASCGNESESMEAMEENPTEIIEETPRETGFLKDQSINISGEERQYHLYIPEIYENAPVILLFHSFTTDYNALLGLNNEPAPYKIWLDIAEQENLIIAAPNGLFVTDNEKGWNDCRMDAPSNSKANDVALVSALIDEIIDKYKANANRVYAVGTSNGGHFCIRLALEIPEKLTAFAAIVAANAVNSKCQDANLPISAMFINGTTDPLLPYEGGEMFGNNGIIFSVENTVADWVSRNGANATPEIIELADSNPNDNDSKMEKYSYTNGKNDSEVVFYKVINGGHTEPSIVERYNTPNFFGNQNGDVEIMNEVWAFFKDKTR